MSAPSYREPNYESDPDQYEPFEEFSRINDEREDYERTLCKRVEQYDVELAKEILSAFGLS